MRLGNRRCLMCYDLWVTFKRIFGDADGFGSGWCVGLDFRGIPMGDCQGFDDCLQP